MILSSYPIEGYYRFGDIFQIRPPFKSAPKPPFLMAHQPVILEYRLDVIGNNGFDNPITLINNKSNELLLLLSVFTDYRFFVYENGKGAWFIPSGKSFNKSKSIWGQEFYFDRKLKNDIPNLPKLNCKKMAKVEPQDYYNRFGVDFTKSADLPNSIDDLFSKYFSLDDVARKAFLSSCTLFCHGVDSWLPMKSLSFAAFVSSIETLVAYDHRNEKIKRCSECNQEYFKVGHKFRNFLYQHAIPGPDFKKYANKLYGIRSKILHQGELLLSDLQNPFLISTKHIDQDRLHHGLKQVTRICLVNWLSKVN